MLVSFSMTSLNKCNTWINAPTVQLWCQWHGKTLDSAKAHKTDSELLNSLCALTVCSSSKQRYKWSYLWFCLSQSTSKWQIITCLCQEGLIITTMPMWSSFWTLLSAYLFRYNHRPFHSYPTISKNLIIDWVPVVTLLFLIGSVGWVGSCLREPQTARVASKERHCFHG